MFRFTIVNKKKAEQAKELLKQNKIKIKEINNDVKPVIKMENPNKDIPPPESGGSRTKVKKKDKSEAIQVPSVKKTRRKRRTKEEMADFRKKKEERSKKRTPEQQKAINERMNKLRARKNKVTQVKKN